MARSMDTMLKIAEKAGQISTAAKKGSTTEDRVCNAVGTGAEILTAVAGSAVATPIVAGAAARGGLLGGAAGAYVGPQMAAAGALTGTAVAGVTTSFAAGAAIRDVTNKAGDTTRDLCHKTFAHFRGDKEPAKETPKVTTTPLSSLTTSRPAQQHISYASSANTRAPKSDATKLKSQKTQAASEKRSPDLDQLLKQFNVRADEIKHLGSAEIERLSYII